MTLFCTYDEVILTYDYVNMTYGYVVLTYDDTVKSGSMTSVTCRIESHTPKSTNGFIEGGGIIGNTRVKPLRTV